MAEAKIGIDLCDSPLRVGGLVIGKYITDQGSREITSTGEIAPTREQVVAGLEDARKVVKSFSGASSFSAAVIVVPNTAGKESREVINSYGQGAYFNISQLISEHTAVAAAYAVEVKPSKSTTLAIISFSGGLVDVSILTIVKTEFDVRESTFLGDIHDIPGENLSVAEAYDSVYGAYSSAYGNPYIVSEGGGGDLRYKFVLEKHEAHQKPVELEEKPQESGHSGGLAGLVGGAVNTLIVEPFHKATAILENILEKLGEIGGPKVEKVVFVGKGSRSDSAREVAKKSFPGATIWDGIDPEEVAAHGAAILCNMDWKVKMEYLVQN